MEKDNSFKYDFFVSYSNSDAKIVEPIVNIMEKEYKAKCWFQLHNSRHEYVNEIIDGIQNSRVFIIFISESSATSNNVLNEVNYALLCENDNDEHKILPIVLTDNVFDMSDAKYNKIRFYLSRYNMLSYSATKDKKAIIHEIFDQVGFKFIEEQVNDSLYHSSDVEASRLQSQNEIMVQTTNEYFKDLINKDSCILDVGCSAGDNIMLRLKDLEYGSLLGIDIDDDQISKANEKYSNDKNSFIVADITDIESLDILTDYLDDNNLMGFDVINISSVLLHIKEPEKVLKYLRRFLKKDGYMFIQEEDDIANIAYPYTDFFQLAYDIWYDSKESGDRHCARKMYGYLKNAGYKKVNLKKCGIANIDLDASKQNDFWDIYFNHNLWEALEDAKFFKNYNNVKVMLDSYIGQYDKVYQEYMNGNIFVQLGFFIFVVQK